MPGHVPDDARVMKEEPFSPVAPDAPFRDDREVMRRANALPFGLVGYPFSYEMRTATMVAEELEVGMVGVTDLLPAAAEAPMAVSGKAARDVRADRSFNPTSSSRNASI